MSELVNKRIQMAVPHTLANSQFADSLIISGIFLAIASDHADFGKPLYPAACAAI